SVISAYQVRRMINRAMTAPRFRADLAASSLACRRGGFLQLDVLPRIGVAGGEVCRENILPFRRRQPRPDRVDEGVPEHRHKVIVLKDRTLNVLCQLLALLAVDRSEILIELGVELRHAIAVAAVEAATPHEAVVPVRPSPADPCGIEDDLHARPFLQ